LSKEYQKTLSALHVNENVVHITNQTRKFAAKTKSAMAGSGHWKDADIHWFFDT